MSYDPLRPLVEMGTEEPMPIIEERAPKESLTPRQWLRKRLFNNWYNSALTVVIGAGVLFGAWKLANFVFITARWTPVIDNLTLFMVGSFPREELWRVAAQVLIWSGAVGLGWGAAVAGAKYRAVQAGMEYEEEPGLARVRRYWGLIVLLLLILAGTRTFGPLLLTIAALAVAVALQMLGSRAPGARVGLLWSIVGLLGVLGYQIVSGFGGLSWLWMGLPLAFVSLHFLGRMEWEEVRRQRIVQGVAVVGTFAVLFGIHALIDIEPLGWDDWEGFHLNLIAAALAIVLAFPLGLLLALGRRSSFPALRMMSTTYIELIRGVPLISLLLMAQFFIGFFLNTSTPLSLMTRALAAMTLFTAAYVAEIVRGGLQAVEKGQIEAGQSVGLSPFAVTRLIVLPQALRAVIPAMVGQFISLFKDTSLLTIIGVSEILNVREVVHSQRDFLSVGIAETLLFVMFAFWAISFTMSRESQRLERRLGVGER
jgi:general L-amino acid transport system permease protein